MSFVPHHTLMGEDPHRNRTVVVLHGIMGAARNWRGFVRDFASQNPGWEFVLVDHRFHGGSGPAAPPHSLRSCAEDLDRLMRGLGREPEVIIGHSFGGKVALEYARAFGSLDLKRVIILDSVPGSPSETQTVKNNQVLQVISAIRHTSIPARERRDVKAELLMQGIPNPIVEWLATSLRSGHDGWHWCFDIDAVAEMIQSYFDTDFWPYLRAVGEEPRLVFIRAERSDRWTEDQLARFSDTQATIMLLEQAGHWLHVDNPRGLGLQLADLLRDC